jgi:hypothetical protein
MKVKVGINGYGTIGKRVASAVSLQDDMEVVGVTKTRPSFEADIAIREGHPLFAACQDDVANFEKARLTTLSRAPISSSTPPLAGSVGTTRRNTRQPGSKPSSKAERNTAWPVYRSTP